MDIGQQTEDMIDLRTLDYVSQYDEHLMCPICHCPFIQPVRLQCDHIFCDKCVHTAIDSSFDTGTSSFPCPTCRAPIKSILNVPRLLISMCDDVKVRCPYAGEGCQEILPRGHVQSHVDKYCDYKLLDCPDVSCGKKIRRKNMSPDQRCLHTLFRCENCEGEVMEQDREAHTTDLCSSLQTTCPDCGAIVFRNALLDHIESCPEAIHACAAAKYGCSAKLKRAELAEHERACPLVTMGPYIEAQNSRIDSLDMMIRQLRQRNEILEEGMAKIRSTLMDSALLLSGSSSDRRENDRQDRPRSRSQSRERTQDQHRSRGSLPDTPTMAEERSSTAMTYLLSLHESLREEVSQLSHALNDLDARASMAIMNESLRIKQDMAHTNAAVDSIRMQVHWLMNPRLHQSSGSSSSSHGRPGTGTGTGAGTGTGTGTGTGPSSSSRGGAARPAPRRLSDGNREGTKL